MTDLNLPASSSNQPEFRPELPVDADDRIASNAGQACDLLEEQGLERAAELQAICDSMIDGIGIIDCETSRLVYVNPAFCAMVGFPADEMMQSTIAMWHRPEDLAMVTADLRDHLTRKRSRSTDIPFRHRDGYLVYADICSSHVTYRGRACMLACAHNTTERFIARQELLQEQETLRQLARASDRERLRLTSQIHDEIEQPILGALMMLQAYPVQQTRNSAKAQQTFKAGLRALRQVSDEIRSLLNRTQSPVLEKYGIAAAIADIVDQWTSQPDSPTIAYLRAMDGQRYVPEAENALYRIAQEAMANACLHSGSDRVEVSLRQDDNELTLRVQDWGNGSIPESPSDGQFGLIRMRQRARLLGSELLIHAVLREGTSVSITVPGEQIARQ